MMSYQRMCKFVKHRYFSDFSFEQVVDPSAPKRPRGRPLGSFKKSPKKSPKVSWVNNIRVYTQGYKLSYQVNIQWTQ